MQTVVTIAGFDPSSGAGVTADLMVFAAHGLFGTACITALTVQSTLGVQSTHAISADVVGATLECLNFDLPPDGVKIGVVANSDIIFRICDYLDKLHQIDSNLRRGRRVVVLDPVLHSTSGRELLDPSAVATLRDRLLPLVDWITPNLQELEVLAGMAVVRRDDLPRVCRALQTRMVEIANGRRLGILVTGGHMDPPDDFLLTPSEEQYWLPGERVITKSTHGTGCALSSAFLSRLVLADSPYSAAEAAKAYVAGALRSAVSRGQGHGPMNHLWKILDVIH